MPITLTLNSLKKLGVEEKILCLLGGAGGGGGIFGLCL